MRAATLRVLVAVAVLTASCGGDDVVAEVDPADDGGVEPAGVEAAAQVDITGFSFEPATIDVEVGDTVVWTNGDATRHTVTAGVDAEPTGDFHLTFAERGDRAALQFTEPGEYRYFCTPHPFMQGTVTVGG